MANTRFHCELFQNDGTVLERIDLPDCTLDAIVESADQSMEIYLAAASLPSSEVEGFSGKRLDSALAEWPRLLARVRSGFPKPQEVTPALNTIGAMLKRAKDENLRMRFDWDN